MAELEEKLQYFTEAVFAEAAAEHDTILREVDQARRKAFSAAEEDARNEANQYIHDETVRIRAEQGREISRRIQDNKRALALRREEIAQQVFAQVRQKLAQYTATPEYEQCLIGLFRQALSRIGGGERLILSLRPQDIPQADTLSALAEGCAVEVRSGQFQLGGLILDCPSRNLRADQTFDSRLTELRGHFAELAGLSLAGQSSPKERDEHA